MSGQTIDRRSFLRDSGTLLLAFTVGGRVSWLSAAEARAAGVPLRQLTAAEAALVERLGEALLPGSAAAGLAHYLDAQLAAPPAESLLILRYLGSSPPYLGFYRVGLAGAARALGALAAEVAEPAAQAERLVEQMGQGDPPGWQGVPAPLFRYVLRADAIDVVYGTPAGFARLGLDYAAHIAPPEGW
ncbi:MAG TPA: hypothetical protein VIW02_03215 [Gammaproteobacteria bacterium]